MDGISFSIWAIVILLGAVQGLFLAAYLLTKRDNRRANTSFALLLTVISLHLFEYALDITGLSLQYPAVIAITYPLLFCMGPLYYLYAHYLLDGSYRANAKALLHFLPAVAVLLMMLPFYTMPAAAKVASIKGLVVGNSVNIPVEQLVFMGVHVVQTAGYILAAYKFIRTKEESLKDYSSDVVIMKKLDWLKGFTLYFFIYFVIYFFTVLLLTFISSYQVEVDYVVLLIMAMSMYVIGYAALINPEIFKALPELTTQAADLGTAVISANNANKNPGLKEKLLSCMEQTKPYLQSELKISELATLIDVPAYQLSQLINEEFHVNFYDFINRYRVDDAKKLLVEDERNFKILAIAYEVGFNSKATFNRVFKKFTDLTPSEYKEKFST